MAMTGSASVKKRRTSKPNPSAAPTAAAIAELTLDVKSPPRISLFKDHFKRSFGCGPILRLIVPVAGVLLGPRQPVQPCFPPWDPQLIARDQSRGRII